MTLEINDRDTGSPKYQGYLIDWNDMNASVHSLACRCASVARSMKRNCFSLRFWGECWIGKTDKKQLVVTLQDPKWMSKDCVNSWSYKGECDHRHEKECVAKEGSEYIYFLNDLEKSENDINGGYSEWSSYSGCSAPCGLGLMERERTCTNPAPAGQGKDCSSLGPMNEEKPCKLRECPVNGGISEWTVFGPCSKSCGGGKSVRTRSCTRPSPSNGGSSCSESTQDLIDCATDLCPIDGNYGLWNDWEICSADCGDGFQIRQRECINPQPQYGGQNCDLIGLSQESRFCKVKECPINGGFGNWNDFSPCSKSCGDGVQTRSRKCNQPAPLYGGDDCDGDSVETKTCQIVDCPIDGSYGTWNSWGSCSEDCGTGVQTHQRECNSPEPQYGGKSCELIGTNQESRQCIIKECPINGRFGSWSAFSPCSKSCGDGVQTRTRKCNQPEPANGGKECEGSFTETNNCKIVDCPIDGSYGTWNSWGSCSAECGSGVQTRQRECNNPKPQYGGKTCESFGTTQESRQCIIKECPINGNYGEWNSWGTCSVDCGTGVQTRQRECDRPKPQYGGKTCELIGSNQEIRNCKDKECPIDGMYGLWNSWGTCSADCGDGDQTRKRECINPRPQYGGKSCELIGNSQESRPCKVKECPINGRFENWSAFFPCSKSCGDGTQIRTRNCNQPAPANGGKDCEGESVETNTCKIVDCPIDGNYGTWNSWGTCSAECGTGVQIRQRECNSPQPQYGGKTCESIGTTQESRECKMKECPINGNYGVWNAWGTCSAECGTGVQTRQRECNSPKPQYGGKTCELIGSNQEIRNCKNKECPIDGMYGLWNSWGTCSADCGDGFQTRKRECINPQPRFGGKMCSLIGESQESRPCKVKECPINGGFGSWSAFSPCSKLCGDGTQTRSRKCNEPAPANGGKDCEGPSVETNKCKIVDCPIDGSYGAWNSWGTCSVDCGSGVQKRQRECNNPKPQYGGKSCELTGINEDIRECKIKECSINGKWSEWEPFSTCSQTCGSANRSKKRTCNNPKPEYGGQPCIGLDVITETCSFIPCPVNGEYGQWSSYCVCSQSCGGGISVRTRSCTNPRPSNGGKDCSGPSTEKIICSPQPCPIHGNYGEWSTWGTCSVDCGMGVQTRQRECNSPKPQYGGNTCDLIGITQDKRTCKLKECPIHGGFGSWSEFSSCSKLCGDGEQTRTRKCDQPAPAYGGKQCVGISVERNVCKVVDCPIDGKWSEWGQFSDCSQTCGSASKSRKRSCTNPAPQYGGKACEGSNTMTTDCTLVPCPVNGAFGSWSKFSTCSKLCGDGEQTRTRKCDQPAPAYGGKQCVGILVEKNICKIVDCPIDGKWSEWEPFSECNQKCGSASKSRKRSCTNPSPKYGGKACEGSNTMTAACDLVPCPVNGGYGQWSSYSSCSKDCGQGTRTRTRQCNLPSPAYGGKNCNQFGLSTEEISCYTQCPTQYATACEGEYLNINCHGRGTIQISAANYGRRSDHICRRWLSHWNRNCGNVAHSRNVVVSRCQNQAACSVRASNEVFGDPCWLTSKYLEVQYYCSG